MSLFEQPPTEWVSLKHGGEEIAEAWFMPEGGTFTVVFLVPRERLSVADAGQRVTVETLLEAAAIPKDAVDSWRLGDDSHLGADGADPGLSQPLPPPPDEPHLTVYVRLKPPAPAAAGDESVGQEVPPEKWQALEALWKAVLGLEGSIDACRLSVDGLRAEMEGALAKGLNVEEKVHALQSDVAQWNKAKGRVRYSLPKAREFVHRATWASALPERKRLEEVVTTLIESRGPLPEVDEVRRQLELLQKDRQVLLAQGNAVQQECRSTLSDIQRTSGTLSRNAADRARQKRSAGRDKGKHL